MRQEEGAISGEGVTDEEEVVAGGEEIGPVQDGIEVLVRCHFWLFSFVAFFLILHAAIFNFADSGL